jgi:hypothetical protein
VLVHVSVKAAGSMTKSILQVPVELESGSLVSAQYRSAKTGQCKLVDGEPGEP